MPHALGNPKPPGQFAPSARPVQYFQHLIFFFFQVPGRRHGPSVLLPSLICSGVWSPWLPCCCNMGRSFQSLLRRSQMVTARRNCSAPLRIWCRAAGPKQLPHSSAPFSRQFGSPPAGPPRAGNDGWVILSLIVCSALMAPLAIGTTFHGKPIFPAWLEPIELQI